MHAYTHVRSYMRIYTCAGWHTRTYMYMHKCARIDAHVHVHISNRVQTRVFSGMTGQGRGMEQVLFILAGVRPSWPSLLYLLLLPLHSSPISSYDTTHNPQHCPSSLMMIILNCNCLVSVPITCFSHMLHNFRLCSTGYYWYICNSIYYCNQWINCYLHSAVHSEIIWHCAVHSYCSYICRIYPP